MRRLVMMGTLAIGALSVSCSFSRFAFTECQLNSECRTAFGWGQVCVESLCEDIIRIPPCAATFPADLLSNPSEYQDRYVIGIQFDQEAFSTESKAAEFAISEVIDQTGLGDNRFAVVVCDNAESSTYDGLTQDEANEMVSEYLADQVGVAAIIGPATSDRVERAFNKVEQYGTLVMSPTATSPTLTQIDGTTSTYNDPGLFWRTSPPDDLQGEALAALMDDDGVQRAVLLVEAGNYGTSLGQKIQSEALDDYDYSVELKPYDRDSLQDLTDKLDDIEQMDVDAVVFVSANKDHTAHFLQRVTIRHQDGCASASPCPFADGGARIYLADGAKDESIFEGVDDVEEIVDRIKGTSPSHAKGDVYVAFADTLDAEFGDGFAESTAFTAHAYDAAWLVVYGVTWAHYNEPQVDGIGIARGLRQVSKKSADEVINIGRNAWSTVRAEFNERSGIDVRGASGDLDYDPTTGETSADIETWCVEVSGDEVSFGLSDSIGCWLTD